MKIAWFLLFTGSVSPQQFLQNEQSSRFSSCFRFYYLGETGTVLQYDSLLRSSFKINTNFSSGRFFGLRAKNGDNVFLLQCFKIERQLNAYLHRVEDVLGKGWETHVEGQRLKEDGDNFKLKLDTQELFEDWSRRVR